MRELTTVERGHVGGGLYGSDGFSGFGDVLWEVGRTGMGDNASYGEWTSGNDAANAMGNVAAGLATATVVLGVAAQATRFIPGAQVLSAELTVLGLGTGALATAASRLN